MARGKKGTAELKLVDAVGTQLAAPERAANILRFDERKKELESLAKESERIKEITNKAGYEECHSARMRLRNERIGIEKIAKAAREDATAFSKAVIAKEKELIGIISDEEDRLDGIQTAWNEKAEAERETKAKAAREQHEKEQALLQRFKMMPLFMKRPDVESVEARIDELKAFDQESSPENIRAQLREVIAASMAALLEILDSAKQEAAEMKALAEERAELERQKEERRKQDAIAKEWNDAITQMRGVPALLFSHSFESLEKWKKGMLDAGEPDWSAIPEEYRDKYKHARELTISQINEMISTKRANAEAAQKLADERAALEKEKQEKAEREQAIQAEEDRKKKAEEEKKAADEAARLKAEKEREEMAWWQKVMDETPDLLTCAKNALKFLQEKEFADQPCAIQLLVRINQIENDNAGSETATNGG